MKLEVHYEKNKSIEECGFSTRVYNCLRRAGIKTVGDIVERIKANDLYKIRGFGSTCWEEISDWFVKDQVEKFGTETVSKRVIE